MRTRRLLPLAMGLLVLGLYFLSQWMQKTVTLVVGDQVRTLHTFALNVGQLIEREKITLYAGDLIDPPLGDWLQPGERVSIERAFQVIISADGSTRSLLTVERVPADILAQAGISLYPGDRVLVDGKPGEPDEALSRAPAHSLQIVRAQPVTLAVGSQVQTFTSSAATLGQALWEAGIRLHAGDRLDPPPETPLDGPVRARLDRSKALRLRAPAGEIQFRSAAATVGAALADAGVPLQGLDYSIPPEDAPLPEDGLIQFVQVRESVTFETEPIPFETESQPVADLEIDQQSIVSPGAYGLSARRVRVRYENGVEVGRQVEREYVAQEPQPRVVGYGTKIVPHSLETEAGTLEYWRVLNMYAVSYNPTSAGGTVTASGLPLEKGVVAVDPNYIPLGTRLYIPGYGVAVAADTGSGVKGRIIDLGYSDHDYVPWHQWVSVYFLWPPPANVVWVVP